MNRKYHLSEEDIAEAKEMRREGNKLSYIADWFGVSECFIKEVVKGCRLRKNYDKKEVAAFLHCNPEYTTKQVAAKFNLTVDQVRYCLINRDKILKVGIYTDNQKEKNKAIRAALKDRNVRIGLLAARGLSSKQIADKLGVSRNVVIGVCKRHDYKLLNRQGFNQDMPKKIPALEVPNFVGDE